ncbi:ATPase, BadF/BadG/BcrA/BcrD type [Moorella glycerini]|uniref:R-phenyllactate dehydratase activator n=1 Tax=Neomoorella stamsii TaxID=1266720 RepID=A0A9X7J1D6_9FIRM|nr:MULTISPECIES: acyl-CoA dehydratase activase [Moorella]PRR71420.1 R-phenyllactate dehydratase activator [Moorella stamsii]CEP68629.1 ATPase, BadF/BadG/BcrA/BcrD type [Moorella glycerini]
MQPCYLGIDVGSVSTNVVVITAAGEVLSSLYIRTHGQPIQAVKEGLRRVKATLPGDVIIAGAGTTGSGRYLAGAIIGADIVKNEITAHAVAARLEVPEVQTILEIGGQDSKIIILRQGVVIDFAMNTVCAAGTGSFLDQQAARLGIPIENFGELALKARHPVRIAGRCTVFAESDMIHKQQMGHNIEDIIGGLCEALVRNYLNNVAKGKEILAPIVFQGGVAANAGIRAAFSKALQQEIIVPRHFAVMGALGAALLARDYVNNNRETKFKGFEVAEEDFRARSFTCQGCSNLCEIVNIEEEGSIIARWGSRCGKWDTLGE